MKSHPLILLAAVLACYGPAAAQSGSPRAQELQPWAQETSVVHDGIVFYRGQTYLIRHSRAVLVDATLVPEGQVLTAAGRLVVLPTDFVHDATPAVREGLFAMRGQVYLIRNGYMMRVDAALVPEGQVLTADGRRVPLPADFSGFVLDRAPDGTVLPTPPAQAGLQVLSGQAGVVRAPSIIPQGRERRLRPPSHAFQRAVAAPVVQRAVVAPVVQRAVAAPVAEDIRVALPLPMSLLPPASAAATNFLLPAVPLKAP
ncbi:MAG: hypothetical protein ACKVY0_22750 [Prosthecobacter sp.]|uniref:hypothetical protein n=1 Tax=Prosthecobacter sp. TaxID=1965333 RepID=UPI0039042FC1